MPTETPDRVRLCRYDCSEIITDAIMASTPETLITGTNGALEVLWSAFHSQIQATPTTPMMSNHMMKATRPKHPTDCPTRHEAVTSPKPRAPGLHRDNVH